MSPVNSLATVSDLRYNYQNLFQRIKKEFVVLTQHNEPKAVLVDVEQWNETVEKIVHLEEEVRALQTTLQAIRNERIVSSRPKVTLAEVQAISAKAGPPPTDAEIEEWRYERLTEKHG